MATSFNFVFFGLQAWDISIGSTAKNIAQEVSLKHNVLFVNPPLTRAEWLTQRGDPKVKDRLAVIANQKSEIKQVSDKLWILTPRCVVESVNRIPIHWLYCFFQRINDIRFSKEVRKATDKLGFKEFIVFDDNSMLNGFYFKELLKPWLFVYLLRDNVIAVDYHKRHGTRMQEKIIRKADLVFCNSDYFLGYCSKFNANSFMIGQGCDVSLYSDKDNRKLVAPELLGIPHPIIGYTGSLTSLRLDIDLLSQLAHDFPQWSFVFVGPEDFDFRQSELHKLSNVYFPGLKPVERLPEFIKGFDVAINPQILNVITNWNYPLKIDEYLAMGKPVVATRTDFMEYFKDNVYLANGLKEYAFQINKAISEDSPALHNSRIACASNHTWANFVDKIYKQIDLMR